MSAFCKIHDRIFSMIALIIFLVCLFVVIGTGVLSGWSDFKGMTIPNLHSLIVLGAFVVAYGAMWAFGEDHAFGPLWSHLASGGIVLVITALMFALKSLGAADSKLGTAYALWMGVPGLLPFLFYMALLGGALGVAALVLRKWKPVKSPAKDSWVDQVQGGASKVPYGIAIVFGAICGFVQNGYADPSFLSQFL